ncbi:hypothetical protein ACLMJK_004618 [Lecanora helva]
MFPALIPYPFLLIYLTITTPNPALAAIPSLSPNAIPSLSLSPNTTLPTNTCWCSCPPLPPSTPGAASSGFPPFPSSSLNSSSNGNKTSWNHSSPTTAGASPTRTQGAGEVNGPVLLPGVKPGLDMGEMRNLRPRLGQEFYYTSGDQKSFARINLHTNFPSVILSHSSHISNVNPTTEGFEIGFSNTEARAYALASWSRAYPLLLVTTEGGKRGFSLVTHYETRGERGLRVVAEVIEPGEAVGGRRVVLGFSKPGGAAAGGVGGGAGGVGGLGGSVPFLANNFTGAGGVGNGTNATGVVAAQSLSGVGNGCEDVPPPLSEMDGPGDVVCEAGMVVEGVGDGGAVCEWRCGSGAVGGGGLGLGMV